MSGGLFESSQRSEPVCATRFSSIKNCFKTQASGWLVVVGGAEGQCGREFRSPAILQPLCCGESDRSQ